jgi:GDP-mannose 6-dehydrogenase
MTTSIAVFGLGYVGTVTAACLARYGNDVIGVDLNPSKVQAIESANTPIIEPQLDEFVKSGRLSGRLRATTDAAKAVAQADVLFLCVGTPSLRNGSLDLGHIGPVCRAIGKALTQASGFRLIVLRSTVLPGTTDSLVLPTLAESSGKTFPTDYGVCVNPEFMREGTAIADFLNPPQTIIGCADPAHGAILRDIYAWAPGRVYETSFRCAEMIKYVSNAWHALKVAFANEVGTLAKEMGVDAEAVVEMFVSDGKLNISPSYLKPGFAFGGSCLPKDLRALNYRAKQLDLHLPLFEAILASNEQHLERAVELVLSGGYRKVAMLGLSFKSATDDLRESPHVGLVKRLLGEGRDVRIWDENVCLGRLIGSNRLYIEEVIPHIGSLLTDDLDVVLRDAELVVVGTRALSKELLREKLRPDQIVVDLVNLEKARRPNGTASYAGICW